MKRLIIIGAFLLAACSTAQQQNAQQVLAKLQMDVSNGCLIVQPTLASLQLIDPAVAAVATANGIFCAANSAVNVASITTIVNTGIPATEAAVQASTLIPANQKPIIVGALTAFQIALSTALVVFNQSGGAVTTPTTPAAPATEASA